jgi:pimeloyl-ACP methyl ester carboxylesterase
MAADSDKTPPIRRGKGLRLSTDSEETEAAPPSPESTAAPPDAKPVSRRRGLRLSTQATPEPPAPTRDDVPIEGTTPESGEVTALAGLRRQIDTARGRVSYLQLGEGKPLLLVHGYGASARIWSRSMQALADQRTLYAIDIPGCGDSPPRTASPTLPALAAEILAFANALDIERFELLGHDLGAAVAATAAARRPDRITRLVTVSLGARAFAPELATLSLSRASFDLTVGLSRPLLNLWQPMSRMMMLSPPFAATMSAWMLHGQPADAELWQDYLADFAGADLRAYLTSLTAVGDRALHDALRTITSPTLCIAGREDRITPLAETTAAQAMIGRSTLVVLDVCGHMPMIEQPEAFHNAVQEFLEH